MFGRKIYLALQDFCVRSSHDMCARTRAQLRGNYGFKLLFCLYSGLGLTCSDAQNVQ